jgi:hypothetical protein
VISFPFLREDIAAPQRNIQSVRQTLNDYPSLPLCNAEQRHDRLLYENDLRKYEEDLRKYKDRFNRLQSQQGNITKVFNNDVVVTINEYLHCIPPMEEYSRTVQKLQSCYSKSSGPRAHPKEPRQLSTWSDFLQKSKICTIQRQRRRNFAYETLFYYIQSTGL